MGIESWLSSVITEWCCAEAARRMVFINGTAAIAVGTSSNYDSEWLAKANLIITATITTIIVKSIITIRSLMTV